MYVYIYIYCIYIYTHDVMACIGVAKEKMSKVTLSETIEPKKPKVLHPFSHQES